MWNREAEGLVACLQLGVRWKSVFRYDPFCVKEVLMSHFCKIEFKISLQCNFAKQCCRDERIFVNFCEIVKQKGWSLAYNSGLGWKSVFRYDPFCVKEVLMSHFCKIEFKISLSFAVVPSEWFVFGELIAFLVNKAEFKFSHERWVSCGKKAEALKCT